MNIDLTPLLKPRCGTCKGTGKLMDTRRREMTLEQAAMESQLWRECTPCRGRGYLDPLCDVIAVRVEKRRDRTHSSECHKWHPLCNMMEQCAEVGVALEIREVSRGT